VEKVQTIKPHSQAQRLHQQSKVKTIAKINIQVQTDIVKQLKELDQQRENVSDKNFVQNKVCGEMLDKQQKAVCVIFLIINFYQCKWLVDNHLDAMLVEARTGKPAETSIERYLAREKLSSGESKH
jgi:hypothetical protein